MANTPDTQRAKPRRKWSLEKWLEVYAEKGTVTAACKVVGISRETAYATRKRDPEFAEAWDKLEHAVTDLLEKTLVEVALDFSHKGQVRALDIALKARRPSKYREGLKVEHGGTIKHDVATSFDHEVEELVTQMREAAAIGDGASS